MSLVKRELDAYERIVLRAPRAERFFLLKTDVIEVVGSFQWQQ
jgi:hypothetical protein